MGGLSHFPASQSTAPCWCRSNMRSSSFRKVESSALIGHGGNTRGAVDVSQGAGPAQGPARSPQTTHHAAAGGGGVGGKRALGAETAGALAGGGRRRPAPRAAGAILEPEDA